MYLYVDFENYIWKTNDKATLTNTIAGALQNDYKNQNNKIQYNSNKVWYAFYEEPEKPPVAQIGEITYSTLEDALEAVKNGETIKLLVEEVPVTQKIAISKKIVIDMNGTKLLNNGFTIVSGGDLTLAGESGEIGDFIKVEKHGLLRIKGNITIKTQSSEAPIKSYGTVFLEHDINELMIDVWAGKFEVAESVNVSGTLRIAMKTESFSAGDKDKEVIINGSVKNLVLKQGIRESKSQATINARVETLELKHTNFAYPSADGQVGKIPTTYIGKNFSAGSIYLIPILGNGNPSYSELVDLREEGKRAADIIMLQSVPGGSISENQIDLEDLGSDDFSGGGGIYVQMDGTATIRKGSIINNKSYKGAYGGGGIYVNGGKSKEHKNGVLNLTKVKISDNTAEGAGGGIAACGTSNVEIRLTDGGIIHGNKGKNVNYDIYYTPGTPEGGGKVEKSDYMLGKGLYEWKRVEGEPLNYLCEYSAAKETTGENLVQVEIRGNYSKTAGGAIGTNGNVYIGTDDDETISIKVIKKWKSDAESTEDMTGEELGSSGGVNEMFTNEGIKIVLRAKLEGEGEDDWREIKSATLKSFQKGNAQWGEWGEITFSGLQECDAKGTKWIYDVVEAEDDRFTVLGKPAFKPNYDSEGKLISYTCTLTNIPTYSLKVSKEVPNFGKYPEYNEDTFKFTITLKHKDGSFYTFDELAALKVKDQESGKELPLPIENINDNEITVVLKHGEFIWLTGLTFGTKYVVKEDSNEDYDTLIKLITYNEGGSPGDTTAFSPDKFKEETVKLGTNAVIFENTVRTPLGKLRISKMVEDGDQKKAWKFTIIFQNQDGTQLGTAASKYPITKYSGIADQEGITKKLAIPGGRLTETLKHGESLEIGDLPAGTKYIVTEDEANTDNYTTTVTGEGVAEVIKELTQDGQEVKKIVIGGNGNIVKDEIAHIMFTNTLNTGSLSMEKTVIGAGGDRLKSFVFTVALTGKDNKPLTGTYSYTGIATEEGVNAPAPDVLTLNARGEGQISLKHGQKITIFGLPAGTSYKVTEVEANQDGYTTEETTPEETTPEETTPQETQPPAPSNPSGGGGGGRRRRITESTPPPTAEETPIPPEEVPLVSIEPEEIPLAMLPSDNSKDLTVIDDGGVPLFGLPRTGDKSIPTGALIGMMFVSLMTACGIHVKKRKEKE